MKVLDKIKRNLHINFQDYYRFRNILDNEIISSNPPLIKYTLFIIKSLQELKKLNQENYDFCNSPIIDAFNNDVDGNSTLFLYFVDKQLAHANCIEENKSILPGVKKISNHPTLKVFQSRNTVFSGPAYTNKMHRGKGFHVYDLVEGCKYCQKKGYKKVYASTKTTNKVSIFGLLTAGFEMIDKVRLFTFIKFTVCIPIKNFSFTK